MAKKTTQRRASSRQERDQLGCMWGFMNMFSFRHGPLTQKLLVDRKHASTNPKNNEIDKDDTQENTNVGGCEGEGNVTITIIKPSVKKLIAEELFIDKEIKKKQREREKDDGEAGQLSDSEIEGRRKKTQRKKNKIRKKSCDNFSHINTVLEREETRQNRSTRSVDIDNMIEEFYTEIHRRSITMKNHKREDYKERLRELVKFLISQKLLHGNRPQENSEILTSKDLMEVFQILGSDEELFLKLLQDPEILVPKDNNNTQDSKWSSLFKKKEDNNNNNNTTPEMLDEREKERIFILKPRSNSSSPDSHLMRNSSSFFLSEIKRKLKHAIKKEQQQQLQFPKNVPTKDHFFLERRMSKKKSLQEEDDEKKQRVSNIYIEAKKHLSEMLNNGETDTKSKQQVERSLGRILSFPEYLSPLSSPGRRWEQTSTTSHRKSSSPDFVNLVNIKKETLANPPEDINDDIHKNKETESSIESLKPISSETTKDIEDDVMVIKEIDIVPEEPSSTLEILQDEQRDSTISKQKNSNVEESQAPVSSSSVASSPSHCLAKTENGQEWSSPISVLEPLFVEDDISPAKMRSGETQIQPWCIHFDEKESTSREDSNQNITTTSDKELVFNYITSILEAIDSNLEDLYLKAQFSDQLLEPSLISNIPFNPNQLCPNHELLFDCINEVIMELCCDPPPWFSKTRVFSTVKSIAREVQEAVYWHLLPLPLPHALDQIVKKDLAKGGNWLDIRCEIDWIGFEISELVIDELLEELIPVRAHICKV